MRKSMCVQTEFWIEYITCIAYGFAKNVNTDRACQTYFCMYHFSEYHHCQLWQLCTGRGTSPIGGAFTHVLCFHTCVTVLCQFTSFPGSRQTSTTESVHKLETNYTRSIKLISYSRPIDACRVLDMMPLNRK